jgi:glycosyltransferase involved in cell wall biosynthesis
MGNKLFLISYYFAPLGRADGVNRTYLVKHLAELGWDIEVISCANPHALLRNFHRDESLLKILPSGVRHHRVRSTYWGPLGGVASLLGMADDPFGNWRWPVLRQARALFHVPGILYAVVPPVVNATIAWEIARDKKYPLVIDFRDNEFKIPPSVVNDAGTIIASTQQSLDEMRRFYRLGNDRGIEVQNGYPEDLRLLPVKQRGRPGQLRIVYAGLLNLEQDPAVLARAVRFMERRYPETRNTVLVDYFGPQNYYTRLFLRNYLSDTIRFRGYRPFQEILGELADADLAYSSLRADAKSYCIPSKVFQYLSVETPILAAGPEGALKEMITRTGIGRFSAYEDLASQANDIRYLLGNEGSRMEMVENIRRIKQQYAMRSQVKTLSEHLKWLVG